MLLYNEYEILGKWGRETALPSRLQGQAAYNKATFI